MPAQTQNQPTQENMTEETESGSAQETAVPAAAKTVSKGRRFLTVYIVLLVCFISVCAGIILRNNSTLFLERRTAEGFLTPEEYILVNPVTGEPGQNVRTIGLQTMHSWDEAGMCTTRGIGEGSSWQDVVEAYGDAHAESILYQPDYNGEYDYSKAIRVEGPITVSEFHEQYVKTGICNPDTDRILIRFAFWHDSFHIYYTREEQQEALLRQSDTPWYLAPVLPNPAEKDFEMSISLIPEKGVEFVSSFFF